MKLVSLIVAALLAVPSLSVAIEIPEVPMDILGPLLEAVPAATPTPTPEPLALGPRNIPNDCVLLATEAFVRLRAAGVWVRMVHLGVMVQGTKFGHAVVCWQPAPGMRILMYDETLFHGTLQLPTSSRDPKTLQKVLNAGAPPGLNIFQLAYYP